MGATRKHPIEFRREEVSFIMQRWRASESCSLVGVGSVGKSNLLQHLADPEVQTYYMQNTNTDNFRTIIIDPNLLGPLPSGGDNSDQLRCWAAYELMMHRMFLAFYPFEVLEQDDARSFYETYQTLQDGTNPLYAYMALRYFELGLEFFMRRKIKIVFMFDEFEDFFKLMPIKFFQTLRGLRDINKRQLSFLTFTRSPLPVLIQQYGINGLDIEPFLELFTDNVCYVGPYNEPDAYRMVEELMSRNQKTYTRNEVEFLLWATGRYAGLIRAGFRGLDSLGLGEGRSQQDTENVLHALSLKIPIRSECKTLWLSLSQPERYILKAVARLSSYTTSSETEQAVTSLVQKRLLRVDRVGHKLEIDPPVFRAFILSDPEIAAS
jgi:hypothetical protein